MTISDIRYTDYTGTSPQPGFVSLFCDSAADLPTVAAIQTAGGVDPLPGSEAICCDSGARYLLDSSGTWHEVTVGGYVDAYTKTETDSLLADYVTDATYTAGQAAQDSAIASAAAIASLPSIAGSIKTYADSLALERVHFARQGTSTGTDKPVAGRRYVYMIHIWTASTASMIAFDEQGLTVCDMYMCNKSGGTWGAWYKFTGTPV